MNHFQQIKERLSNSAVAKLHCPEDQLDPAVKWLTDAMALELSALQLEQQQSDRRVLKKLAETLRPAMSGRALPLCGVVHAAPKSASATLTPEHCFETEVPAKSAFFSPLTEVKIFKARVEWVISKNAVFQQESPVSKRRFPVSEPLNGIRANEIWLGLSLDDGIFSPEGMSIFLDWEAAGGKTAQVLSMLQAGWNGWPLQVKTGFPVLPFTPPMDFAEEQFMQQQVEQPALEHFQHRFLTLGSFLEITPEDFKASKTNFPHGEAGYPWAAEPMHWLKIIFPVPLSEQEVEQMPLAINCFPALNRRLRYQEIHADQPVQVLSLGGTQGESFLGLQKVFSKSAEFQPAIAPDFGKAPAGSYALQQGRVCAPDVQEGRQQVEYLLHLLRTEAAMMKMVFRAERARGDVEELLRRLEESLAALEACLPAEHPGAPGYYLHLKPVAMGENVFVHFWVAGEDVSGGGEGAKLKGQVEFESCIIFKIDQKQAYQK